ncbi:MAG: M48 family metallopeptidase, partial [Actinomycetia bacterium]|nr:M48 family metallopeptidase [Actinomycetes bacterium]
YMAQGDIEIRRSRRRTLALEVRDDGAVLVRAPLAMGQREIERFVRKKADWIARTRERVQQRRELAGDAPDEEQVASWKWAARRDLALRLAYWAPRIGAEPGKLSVRFQHARWGSCSGRTRTISLNCQLMRVDEELRDYVVVHELCHLLQPDHSPEFWRLVERQLPDYRKRRKALHAVHLW